MFAIIYWDAYALNSQYCDMQMLACELSMLAGGSLQCNQWKRASGFVSSVCLFFVCLFSCFFFVFFVVMHLPIFPIAASLTLSQYGYDKPLPKHNNIRQGANQVHMSKNAQYLAACQYKLGIQSIPFM